MRRILVGAGFLFGALGACATPKSGTDHLLINLPDLTTFALVDTDAGRVAPRIVSTNEAADILARYDVVFIGEAHSHPGNHLAEMQLFRNMYQRAPALSLSMEQFERDVQSVVNDYLDDKIGEATFIDKARAWDNYPTSYRPLVEFAKEHKLPVIAANAPEKAVRCVGEEGLAFLNRMKPDQRGWVAADVHADEGAYRAKFMGFATNDSAHGREPDNSKAV